MSKTGWGLETTRLYLKSADLGDLQAELRGTVALAERLVADIPVSWPPESLVDALPWFVDQARAAGGNTPWLAWYALQKRFPRPRLIGGLGFVGEPDESGVVTIGYSLLPEFQGQGFAIEMVRALTAWALKQPEVRAVSAQTDHDNHRSIALLQRLGFVEDSVLKDGTRVFCLAEDAFVLA